MLTRAVDSYGFIYIGEGDGKGITDNLSNRVIDSLNVPIKYKSGNHIVINFNMKK